MRLQEDNHHPWRTGRLLGLALAVVAVLAATSAAQAQDATPAGGPATLLIGAPAGPLSVGDEFEVQVLAEDVEHLAAFEISLDYDSDLLSLKSGEMGPFFIEGERQQLCMDSPFGEITFADDTERIEGEFEDIEGAVVQASLARVLVPAARTDEAITVGGDVAGTRVFISCFTVDPPVSLDGPPGISGSGVITSLVFRAVSGGETSLRFSDTLLILDDIDPPGDPEGTPVTIRHATEGATLVITGGDDGGTPWLLIGIIVGVVVAVVAAAFAFLVVRSRQAPDSFS